MPLPVTVVCELLGVPVADRKFFQRFAEIVFSTTGATAQEMAEADRELRAYLIAHIGRRRQWPEDDLISQLIAVRDEDEGRLSEQELLSMAGSILVAGHESTANEISNFVWTLLTRDLWSYLVSHPEAVDAGVEELLRHVALGSGFSPPRIALEDIEIAGRLIPKGDAVIANLISANRDQGVFSDADEVNLARESNPHLSFGFGPHHCLGAQLARMELRTALRALLSEFPQLHFSGDPDGIVWRAGTRARGPRKMMLSWLQLSQRQG
jgi:cytochrome P450